MNSDKFSTINGEMVYNGNFSPIKQNKNITNDTLVFCYANNQLLLIDQQIPVYQQIKIHKANLLNIRFFGSIKNKNCFVVELNDELKKIYNDSLIDLRQAYGILNEDYLKATIFSSQIVNWNKKTQFCGACGTKTIEAKSIDWVKTCPNCNENFYPKISPAIIVAIQHKGKLLMAQHTRLPDFYAIIAGFVNPGESLEECVHREVKEETNIEIENIQYFSSQSWPFPDSLMAGFKADYKSGDVQPDQTEIIDLKWCAPNEIPEWTNRSSIARTLIDDFILANS